VLANLDMPDIPIGEVARRTGVPVATLRMWEARYGFPTPRRRGSGHRRYTERDCVVLREVKRDRDAGASMNAAIARATRRADLAETSIYTGVRHRHPHLEPAVLPEPFMLAISRAIEQEATAYGADSVLVGCFQSSRAWQVAEARWRKLAANSRLAVVFAEFPDPEIRTGVWTVPIEPDTAIGDEWAVVCDGPRASACLVGVELPRTGTHRPRRFEAVWSVDPGVVRDATRIGLGLAIRQLPELTPMTEGLARRADVPPKALEQASALTNRVITNALHIGRAAATREAR
jgi:MerR family transcriptional regulator, light-induced transcriptional regulator